MPVQVHLVRLRMRDLMLAVPSRGRPRNIRRMISALDATCAGDTTLYVGLDANDETLGDYPGMDGAPNPPRTHYVVCDNLHKVTAWTNHLVDLHHGDYRAFGQVGEDNSFSTPGWDTQIMAALEKTPFAFGNDQYPSREPGTLCCHVFMRAEIVKALGYFGPPSIAHMYVDVAWYAWGVACGITYLHDVLIPHLHYTSGGAAHDATYANSYAGTGADLQAWHAYCRDGSLNADIRKLGGTEFTSEALAEFNRSLLIPEHW
jgi:hypothetical protein